MEITKLCTILSVFLVSLTLSHSSPSESGLEYWCSQTPYPQTCQYFMCQRQHFSINTKSQFKKMIIQIALDQAIQSQTLNLLSAFKYWNDRQKSALADCLQLFENAVFQLNNTLNHFGQYKHNMDAQTWVTAALTNINMCRTGLTETGVCNNIVVALMLKNVTESTSNCLAFDYNDTSTNEMTNKVPNLVKNVSNVPAKTNLVVAQDGSGDLEKIQQAVDVASSRNGTERFVIYVKAGIYNESVQIGPNGINITMIGDGIGKTIITGTKSFKGGSTTLSSATFSVIGDGFIARNMTFRNTAGPTSCQAVALVSQSDLSAYYHCSFEGNQDTLFVLANRQFYRECDIYGTVDFIFGNAAAVFQNCNIYVRTDSSNFNTITAQGRDCENPNQNSGIVIQNSKVMPATLEPNSAAVTYLGRPWKDYSRTIFLKTFLHGFIDPAGWLAWNNETSNLKTIYYGEYQNTGPGSFTKERVKWDGYHVINDSAKASEFTVGKFLSGHSWLPSLDIPFTLEL
ncbi:Pectinesterase [Quillaja saponaria]|uniref:Pectinesterase n=1 Tax=Quillaja saponaria TaxID=32244 RepID=A0AAD7PFT7_QUISA|nr:Pectinesterase [Quillaja saponaria]